MKLGKQTSCGRCKVEFSRKNPVLDTSTRNASINLLVAEAEVERLIRALAKGQARLRDVRGKLEAGEVARLHLVVKIGTASQGLRVQGVKIRRSRPNL